MSIKISRWRSSSLIWSAVAAVLSFGVLAMVFQNIDLGRLPSVLLDANMAWIVVLVVALPMEQVVRGWKWRQILYDIQPVGAFRLFGAVMAGYFANMLVPVGVSPFVRAWLVARLERLKVPTVLVTTAIERFVDGIVFAIIVGIIILFAALPSAEENLRLGLMASGGASLVLFSGLFVALFLVKKHLAAPVSASIIGQCVAWLERAFGGKLAGLGSGMAEGIIWPKSHWRSVGVIIASIGMKLISTTHFLWAGLAFGILLSPFDYLLIMVISGFAMIIARFVRLSGGGVIGSAFALKLLGVADEEALTMVLVVYAASLVLTATVGAIAMWKSGLTVLNLRQHFDQHSA